VTVFRVDANHVLLVSTAVVPICMVIIPLCRALSGLAFILGVMGLCMGCIDCLANLQMINIHGNAVAPFLHVSKIVRLLRFCSLKVSCLATVYTRRGATTAEKLKGDQGLGPDTRPATRRVDGGRCGRG